MNTCNLIYTVASTNGSTPWNGRGILQWNQTYKYQKKLSKTFSQWNSLHQTQIENMCLVQVFRFSENKIISSTSIKPIKT